MAAVGIVLLIIGLAIRNYAGNTWNFDERRTAGNAAICLLIPGVLLLLASAATWLWRHAP